MDQKTQSAVGQSATQREQDDMWNYEYQKARHIYHKRFKYTPDCCDLCLLSFLKYLIHVFVAIIVFSFIIMGIIVSNQNDAFDDFNGTGPSSSSTQAASKIASILSKHPMIYGLQKGIQLTGGLNKTEQQMTKYLDLALQKSLSWGEDEAKKMLMIHPIYVELQKQSPLGMMRSYKVFQNDQLQSPMDINEFYQNYVSQSLPVLFLNQVKKTKLYSNIQNAVQNQSFDDFLQNNFYINFKEAGMNTNLDSGFDGVINYKQIIRDSSSNRFWQNPNKVKVFTNQTKKYLQDRKSMSSQKYKYYIEDQDLNPYPRWQDPDYKEFQTKKQRFFLEDFLQPRTHTLTIWSNFNRRPKKLFFENQICVYSGNETFRMVSPIFRKNIYVGVFEKLPPTASPIDFFNIDYDHFPFAKQVNFLEVTLEAGDCLYVPAYYYIQSKTVGLQGSTPIETIMIARTYESHSAFVDLMLEGLEKEIMTDDQMHQYDKQLKNLLNKFY